MDLWHECALFLVQTNKSMVSNRLFLIIRYFFWIRRWRLCAGRLPGNSYLESGEYKHGTLDQSSNPWLYHVNHFLFLDTKWRQWCCTQTSWCYGSNTYRLVYRSFQYLLKFSVNFVKLWSLKFNVNFVPHRQLMLPSEALQKSFLCFFFFPFFFFLSIYIFNMKIYSYVLNFEKKAIKI